MDWSKAKNILIIAFTITNIFLIINIEKNMLASKGLPMPIDRTVENVVHILEEKNIKVEADVPRHMAPMAVLEVEYETYDEDKMMKLFQGRKDANPNGRGQVEIINGKMLVYTNPYAKGTNGPIDHKKALNLAEKFLRAYGFMKSDVDHWRTVYHEEGYEITFKQKYKNTFLEESYMRLMVSKTGAVRLFERIWLRPLKVGSHKNEIIPSTKALLKSVEKMGSPEEEKVITDIALGYRFDPPNWQNVKSGTAFPVWRIVLKEGDVIFIDAYEND